MTRLLLCQVLIFLCASASSQTIHKWTDESGRVHYGDRSEAAKGKPTTKIDVPVSPPTPIPSTQPPRPMAAGSPAAEEVVQPPSTPQANLPKCLVMARAMADSKDLTPADIRARSKELLSLCPNIAYACVSYVSQPASNACEAVAYRPGGGIVSHRTYH